MASLSHLLLYFFLFSFFLITGLASSNSSFLSGNLLFLPSFVCVWSFWHVHYEFLNYINLGFFFFFFGLMLQMKYLSHVMNPLAVSSFRPRKVLLWSLFPLSAYCFCSSVFFFMLIVNATEKWKMCSNFCRCRFSFLDFSLISVSHCRLMSEILTDIMALIPNKWCNIFLLSVSVSFPTSYFWAFYIIYFII